MMSCVAGVVAVMWQGICGVVMRLVRNEKGGGGSSPCCASSPAQSIVRPSSRGGVPVLSRPKRESQPRQGRREPDRRRLADPAGRDFLLADMDEAAQKRPRGDDHCAGGDGFAVGCHHARHGAGSIERQVGDLAFADREVRDLRQQPLHGLAIELAVGLGPRPAHRRAFGAVEDAELDAGQIGGARDDAVERVDLAHQMALGEAADRRVARHLADRAMAVRREQRRGAEARRSRGRLAAGMAAADHDHVVAHLPALYCFT